MQHRPQIEGLFRLGRLVRKELVEIVRDRRTMITLVLMPLLLYPLLSVAFQQFFLASSLDPNRGSVYRFGFATQQEADVFFEFLSFGAQLLETEKPPKEESKDKAPVHAQPVLEIDSDPEKLLRDGKVALAVRLKNSEQFRLPLRRDVELGAEIQFVSNNPAALGALTYVERRLAAVHE